MSPLCVTFCNWGCNYYLWTLVMTLLSFYEVLFWRQKKKFIDFTNKIPSCSVNSPQKGWFLEPGPLQYQNWTHPQSDLWTFFQDWKYSVCTARWKIQTSERLHYSKFKKLMIVMLSTHLSWRNDFQFNMIIDLFSRWMCSKIIPIRHWSGRVELKFLRALRNKQFK